MASGDLATDLESLWESGEWAADWEPAERCLGSYGGGGGGGGGAWGHMEEQEEEKEEDVGKILVTVSE